MHSLNKVPLSCIRPKILGSLFQGRQIFSLSGAPRRFGQVLDFKCGHRRLVWEPVIFADRSLNLKFPQTFLRIIRQSCQFCASTFSREGQLGKLRETHVRREAPSINKIKYFLFVSWFISVLLSTVSYFQLYNSFWVFTRRHFLVRNQIFGTTSLSHLQGLEVIQYSNTSTYPLDLHDLLQGELCLFIKIQNVKVQITNIRTSRTLERSANFRSWILGIFWTVREHNIQYL